MNLLLAFLVAAPALLTLCFIIELIAGIRPLRSELWDAAALPRAVIIVPAHDEQAILAERLRSLREAAEGQGRILVVADNCSDSTAEIARRFDVDVVERTDPAHRGKGYALDFAMKALRSDPPGVVLIIDADCMTDAQSVATLIAACSVSATACQSTNLQVPSPASSPTVKLSTFAFFIKNVIRQRSLQRLAGRVHLLGTGMALPWDLFAGAELATGEIVEDLKLGLDLAEAGHPPRFVEGAIIWSNAETPSNTLSQRRRWEGGFLRHAICSGPVTFFRSLQNADLRGLWTAVDLMIPPFALLLIIDFLTLGLATILALLSGTTWWPATLLATLLLLAGLALGIVWMAGGYRFVGLWDLARAPLYIAWKLPLYLGFVRRGAPKDWNRTDRGGA